MLRLRGLRCSLSGRRTGPGRPPCYSRRAKVYSLRALYPCMPGTRLVASERRTDCSHWCACMTSIAILGDSLRSLSVGHHILDAAPEAEISIITDRAEIGLIGEVPGMISSWPPCPPHWISDMSTQTPTPSSTAVRGSWFLKAVGIQLSKRGCTFLLRTRVTTTSDKEARFVGGGPMGSGAIKADHILDLRNTSPESKRWYGFVCRTDDSPESAVSGERTDGTTEIWAQDKPVSYTHLTLPTKRIV